MSFCHFKVILKLYHLNEEDIMEILRVENLTKIYKNGSNEIRAVDNVSFSVEKGDFSLLSAHQVVGKVLCFILLVG